MIIFMSQAPILVAVLLMLLLIALFELIGLKARYNIAVLSAVSLLCLGAAALERNGDPVLPAILYAVGVSLAMLLALYALATARRGRQRMWFVGLLVVAILTLAAVIVRSEERRVGKECRSWWAPCLEKRKERGHRTGDRA